MFSRRQVLAGLLGSLSGWMVAGPLLAADDPVVFSFAFVGCNRLNKAGVDATQIASTANAAQLLQTFEDIGKLKPLPQYLFLAGDIVKGKKNGTKKLAQQLNDWQALTKGKLDKNIKLVVLTGNHEVLKKVEAPGAPDSEPDDEIEVPNQPAYPYWQDNMRPYIFGKNGPAAGGPDGLLNDEKRLSYSFSDGGNLFMILNTDSQLQSAPTTTGDIPLAWIKANLASAQQDKAIQNIFVMGHKPIVSPGKVKQDEKGAETILKAQGGDFYAALNTPAPGASATKVRAYLSAHAHLWQYDANLSAYGLNGTIPQVVAGNAGSPPEAVFKNGYFGYTLVSITKSGKITAQSYGRPIPQPDYYAQTPKPQAATLQGSSYTLFP